MEIGTAIRLINEAGSNPPEMPNTTGLTDQQKFDVYSSIVQTRGNQAVLDDLANGNSVIVGLRSESSTLDNSGRGVYDDRIAVISRDAGGTVHVEEFSRVSTEPSAQYDANLEHHPDNHFRRPYGEDVTGDGVLDQRRKQLLRVRVVSNDSPPEADMLTGVIPRRLAISIARSRSTREAETILTRPVAQPYTLMITRDLKAVSKMIRHKEIGIMY